MLIHPFSFVWLPLHARLTTRSRLPTSYLPALLNPDIQLSMRFSTFAPLAFVASAATLAAAYPVEYEYAVISRTCVCILTLPSRARSDYDLWDRDDYDLYARGDYDLWSRSDNGLYLSARDLDDLTLLARDLLYARLDEPKREHYKDRAQYEAAWKSWNRHNGQILRDQQKTLAKHPHAGEPQPSTSDHAAWQQWNHDNRHVDHHMQDTIHREGHAHHKDVQKIEKGKECKKRRGSKCVVL